MSKIQNMLFQPFYRKLLLGRDDFEPKNKFEKLFYYFERWQVGWFVGPLFGKKRDSFSVFDTDVLVTGSNPILNILIAIGAAKKGYKVSILPIYKNDNWPYLILKNSKFVQIFNSLYKTNFTKDNFFDELFDYLYNNIISFKDNITIINNIKECKVSNRVINDEMVAFLKTSDDRFYFEKENKTASKIIEKFNTLIVPNLDNIYFNNKKRNYEHYDVLFTKSVILTSRIENFTKENYKNISEQNFLLEAENKKIAYIGSAKKIVYNKKDIIHMVVEDLMIANSIVEKVMENNNEEV